MYFLDHTIRVISRITIKCTGSPKFQRVHYNYYTVPYQLLFHAFPRDSYMYVNFLGRGGMYLTYILDQDYVYINRNNVKEFYGEVIADSACISPMH